MYSKRSELFLGSNQIINNNMKFLYLTLFFSTLLLFANAQQTTTVSLVTSPADSSLNLEQKTFSDGSLIATQLVLEDGIDKERMKQTLLQLALQTDQNCERLQNELDNAKALRTTYATLYQTLSGQPLDTVLIQQFLQAINGTYHLIEGEGATRKSYVVSFANGVVTQLDGARTGTITPRPNGNIVLKTFFAFNLTFKLRPSGKWVAERNGTRYLLIKKQ